MGCLDVVFRDRSPILQADRQIAGRPGLRPRSDSLCTGSTRLVGPPGDADFTGDLAIGLKDT